MSEPSRVRSMLAPWSWAGKGVSLKIVIFMTCVALIVACAGTVALVTYRANSGLILSIARDSFEKTGVETINNTEYLLQPVSAAIDSMATLIEDDNTSINKPSLSRFLYGIIDLYPQVYSSYVASSADGRFVQVQRIDPAARVWGPKGTKVPPNARFVLRTVDGAPPARSDDYRYISTWGEVVATERSDNATYDPRGRPFYGAALSRADRVLTDIYKFASNGKPGITIAKRLEREGKLLGVVAADITLEHLSQFLAAQPVGEHGVALIVDGAGQVVAAPDRLVMAEKPLARSIQDLGLPALSTAWDQYKATSAKTFTFSGSEGDYLAAFRRFPAGFDKDWIIMEVAPVDDFVGELKRTLRQITILSLVIAGFGGVCALFIAGQITKPIDSLTLEADRIRSLVLDGAIESSSRIREIQHLIDSMAAMKTALRTLAGEDADEAAVAQLLAGADQRSPHAKLFKKVMEKVERRRARDTELSLASAIQHSVLPRADNTDGAVQISARMRAAKEIGGDFYDWVWRGNGKLVFVIGDVSGKGIPAALFMASTRTAIRTMIMSGASVAETVAGTNRLLSENNDRCFFVTLFIAELDLAEGKLSFVNAGHEPARVIGLAGTVEELLPCGPALGVVEEAEFEAGIHHLRPGDTIVVLTDGVTDAVSGGGERFGETRLGQATEVAESDVAASVVERIFTAVDRFAGDELQFDDITCMVLRYRAGEAAERAAA